MLARSLRLARPVVSVPCRPFRATPAKLGLLKGMDGLLTADLLHVLRSAGHGDEICLVDWYAPHRPSAVGAPGYSRPKGAVARPQQLPRRLDGRQDRHGRADHPGRHRPAQRRRLHLLDHAAGLLRRVPRPVHGAGARQRAAPRRRRGPRRPDVRPLRPTPPHLHSRLPQTPPAADGRAPAPRDAIHKHAPGVAVEGLDRFGFYERSETAFAIVQCVGERRPYGNVILKKGVVGPDGKDLMP